VPTSDEAPLPRNLGPFQLLSRLPADEPYGIFVGRARLPGGLVHPALVLVAPESGPGPAILAREAELGLELAHPGLMTPIAAWPEPGPTALALARPLGRTTGEVLQRVGERGGRVPSHAALFVAVRLLEALGRVHEATDDAGRRLDAVLRVLTLDRVWIGLNGEVRLRGLGYARTRHRAAFDPPSGWPAAFATAEHVHGDVDPRTDLFGVGALLYALLTGRREAPSPRPGLERLVPDLNPRVAYVVRRLVADDPAERFATAPQARDEIARILFGEDPAYGPGALGQWVTDLFGVDAAAEAHRERLLAAPLDGREAAGPGPSPRPAHPPTPAPGPASPDPTPVGPPRDLPPFDDGRTEVNRPAPVEPFRPEPTRGAPTQPDPPPVRSETEPAPPPAQAASTSALQTPSSHAVPYATAPPPPSLAPPSDLGPTTGSPPVAIDRPDAAPRPVASAGRSPPKARTLALVALALAVGVGGAATLSRDVRRTLRHAIVGRKPGAVLVIESIPKGARVVLDGVDTQRATPLTAENIESDVTHTIRLEREGSAAVTGTVSLAADTEKTVTLTFPDAVVEAKVASVPEDATLIVGGRKLGFTPFTTWLNVGQTSTLTVQKVGYVTWKKAITPEPGSPIEVRAVLEKTEELRAAEAAEAAARRAMGR